MPLDPTRAQGIDCYFGNGSYNPTAKPIDFFIAKSSEGTAKDPRFDDYHNSCASIGRLFGAYHYMRTSVPWKVQADVMLGQIAGRKVCMLWWDYEPKNNTLTPKSAADAVSAMSYLRQQTGKPVGLYADRQRALEIYRDAPMARDFPLWFAQYYLDETYWNNTPNIQPKFTPQFKNPLPYLLWQYASELNWLGHDAGHEYGVESHSVDINVSSKTSEELVAYLSLFEGNRDIFDNPPQPELTVEQRLTTLEAQVRELMLGG